MHNYGEALRYQRDIAGLSLTDLGKKIGTSSQNLGRWEREEVIPNIDFCVRLANFYGISIDELLGLDSNFQSVTLKTPADDIHFFDGQRAAPAPQSTSEENDLLFYFRELSPYLKGVALDTVRAMVGGNVGGSKKEG